MSVTISISEASPEKNFDPFDERYNRTHENFGDLQVPLNAVWPRIESYIARRWWTRDIEFLVDGDGDWLPPVVPFVATSIERWDGASWVDATPASTFVGGWYLEEAKYRFTGTVGSVTTPSGAKPPGDVQHAVRRLAQFINCNPPSTFGRSEFAIRTGSLTIDYKAPPNRDARALIYSGAADLLRPYRKAHANQ